MARQRWPRDLYQHAVWQSNNLKPLEKLVALAYANWAKDGDTAWLPYSKVMSETGMSRDAIARALKGLRHRGWLDVVIAASGTRATVYRLIVPSSTPHGPLDEGQQSVSQTTRPVDNAVDVAASSPSPDMSRPSNGPPAVRETDTTTHLTTHLTTHEVNSKGDLTTGHDLTHGNRHRPDNPDDIPCRQCGIEREEMEMAASKAKEAQRRAELDAKRCSHGVVNGAKFTAEGDSVGNCGKCRLSTGNRRRATA